MAPTGHDEGKLGAEQAAVQAEVARLRDDLLGGRGPGAPAMDVLARTRDRRSVGGRAVPHLREQVAQQAAAARRDPDALARYVVGDRTRLAADLDVLVPRIRAGRFTGTERGHRARRVRYLGRVALVLVGLLIGRRLGRHRTRPDVSRHRNQIPA